MEIELVEISTYIILCRVKICQINRLITVKKELVIIWRKKVCFATGTFYTALEMYPIVLKYGPCKHDIWNLKKFRVRIGNNFIGKGINGDHPVYTQSWCGVGTLYSVGTRLPWYILYYHILYLRRYRTGGGRKYCFFTMPTRITHWGIQELCSHIWIYYKCSRLRVTACVRCYLKVHHNCIREVNLTYREKQK